MTLDEKQIQRYARQIVLPEIGGKGQNKLLTGSVLIIGAGGLGCPLALYLAGAGVGRIGVIDDDRVDASNLHRQIAFDTNAIDQPKATILAARMQSANPDCKTEPIVERLDRSNAKQVIGNYDIIADGSDNLKTRLLVHDTAFALRKPLASAAVQGFDGQLTVYRAFDGAPNPCMHCHQQGSADESLLPSCAGGGVFGPVAGVMASMQAIEVGKLMLGMEGDLSGSMVFFDGRTLETANFSMPKREGCSFCA